MPPLYKRSERVPHKGRGTQFPYPTLYIDCGVDPDYAGTLDYLSYDFWHPEQRDARGITGHEEQIRTRLLMTRAWIGGMIDQVQMYLHGGL